MKRKSITVGKCAGPACAYWMLAVIALLITSLAQGIAAEMALPHVAKFGEEGALAYSAQDHALAEEIASWARKELHVARMAKAAGASAEVRALAQTLVTYQVRMLSALRELARSHGRSLSKAQSPAADGLHAPFARAKRSAFDRAFREHLRSDPAALQLFSRVAKEARNRDLRRLAESTLGELKSRRPRATKLYLAEIQADAQKIDPKSGKGSGQRSKTTAKSREKAAASEKAGQPPASRTSTTAAVSADVRPPAQKPKKRIVAKTQKKRSSAARSSARSYSSAELRAAPRPKVISRPRARR